MLTVGKKKNIQIQKCRTFIHLHFHFCPSSATPSIPPSISVCWSSEGVGVFSLVFKGGHPKVKLLWAAGGRTLTPLVSSETEEIGDDGQRELKSVCALETSTNLLSPSSKQQERRKNGQTSTVNDSISSPLFFLVLRFTSDYKNNSIIHNS